MTDARFPEKWLNDRRVLRLSDPAFRLFMIGLAWAVSNRTDGELYDDDLDLMPSADPAAVAEVEKSGLWERDGDRWVITVYAATQTTRAELEQIEAAREKARLKKARQRASSPRGRPGGQVPGQSAGQSRATPRGTSQDRTGKDRTGRSSSEAKKNAGVNPHRAEDGRGDRP